MFLHKKHPAQEYDSMTARVTQIHNRNGSIIVTDKAKGQTVTCSLFPNGVSHLEKQLSHPCVFMMHRHRCASASPILHYNHRS